MLLSAYLVLNLDQLDDKAPLVDVLSANVESQLTSIATTVQSIIDTYDFKRIIYLGSHMMRTYTQESALKVLELTAGRIPTMYESPMGFRHGPKSFIDETALIVVYLNDEPLIRKYELDLIAELQRQQKGYKILLVSHQPVDLKTDYAITLPYDAKLPMVLVGLEMMMVAHCIGFLEVV